MLRRLRDEARGCDLQATITNIRAKNPNAYPNFKECPGCGEQQGHVHRGSLQLWKERADRARVHKGVDPVSGYTLEAIAKHMNAIGTT